MKHRNVSSEFRPIRIPDKALSRISSRALVPSRKFIVMFRALDFNNAERFDMPRGARFPSGSGGKLSGNFACKTGLSNAATATHFKQNSNLIELQPQLICPADKTQCLRPYRIWLSHPRNY